MNMIRKILKFFGIKKRQKEIIPISQVNSQVETQRYSPCEIIPDKVVRTKTDYDSVASIVNSLNGKAPEFEENGMLTKEELDYIKLKLKNK